MWFTNKVSNIEAFDAGGKMEGFHAASLALHATKSREIKEKMKSAARMARAGGPLVKCEETHAHTHFKHQPRGIGISSGDAPCRGAGSHA